MGRFKYWTPKPRSINLDGTNLRPRTHPRRSALGSSAWRGIKDWRPFNERLAECKTRQKLTEFYEDLTLIVDSKTGNWAFADSYRKIVAKKLAELDS